jgi:hypothetical protein
MQLDGSLSGVSTSHGKKDCEMAEKIYLCNMFSLDMLDRLDHNIAVRLIDLQDVRDFHDHDGFELVSVVDHPDMARVFANLIAPDKANEWMAIAQTGPTVVVNTGQRLVVGCYRGTRLEIGAKELPPGAVIEWALVVISRGRSV